MEKINKEKLLSSNFISRFLNLVERFDEECNKDTKVLAKSWVKDEEYDYIKYFLFTTPIESVLPVSLHEFAQMSTEEIINLHNLSSKLSSLLNEKQALYEELISYYE